MGQLAPARFKTNHKASGGLYAGQGYVDIAKNKIKDKREFILGTNACLLYTSPSPRDQEASRMPSSA